MTRRPSLILNEEDRAAVAAWSRFNLAVCGFIMSALLVAPMVYRTTTISAEAKATLGISAAASINPTELTVAVGSLPVTESYDPF